MIRVSPADGPTRTLPARAWTQPSFLRRQVRADHPVQTGLPRAVLPPGGQGSGARRCGTHRATSGAGQSADTADCRRERIDQRALQLPRPADHKWGMSKRGSSATQARLTNEFGESRIRQSQSATARPSLHNRTESTQARAPPTAGASTGTPPSQYSRHMTPERVSSSRSGAAQFDFPFRNEPRRGGPPWHPPAVVSTGPGSSSPTGNARGRSLWAWGVLPDAGRFHRPP